MTIAIIQMITPEPPPQKKQKTEQAPLPMIIAVDFDGTLCQNRWPRIGKANQPVIDWLIIQHQKGIKLILWTMREGKLLDEAVEWCRSHGLTFDSANDNLAEVKARYGNNPRKVYADYYLDDHNI